MATNMNQLESGDKHMLLSSNDNAMMKDILATHFPDETTNVDVKTLLQIIKDIMHRAHPDGPQAEVDAIEDGVVSDDDNEMLKSIAFIINKLSCEISCKCIGGGDAHVTTTWIFNTLSIFGWHTKVVFALAAFAVYYGEFWMMVQPHNPITKSLSHLKQLPDVESFKQMFNTVTSLIKAMLDVTQCIINFKELPAQYISPDAPELVAATTRIPMAVYWVIRSIVSCESILINLIGMGHKHVMRTTEASELSSLAHKINNIHDYLKHQLDLCNQHINEMKRVEAYVVLLRFMERSHLDNTKPLKRMIYLKDDQLPLYEGSTKNRVSIDTLKGKTVLLLISNLDIPHGEISILEQIYREAKQNPTRPDSLYEIVWLVVVPTDKTTPWTMENQIKFETLRNMMPWYSMFDPSLLDPAVIMYIKEVWHFTHRSLLVVMDPQGKIVNTNALHMMWIWGNFAFPFTSQREETLWREETWRMELLGVPIEPMIFNWIAEGKYICLYGGDDIVWIRKFTTTAKTVAHQAGIKLEMLYVGKSNPKEKVNKTNNIIQVENLSYVLPDLILIWFFWARIESMLYSKLQHGKYVEDDPILREIMELLTYDGSEVSWAVICRGSNDWMRKVKGDILLTSLTNYDEWRNEVHDKGFLRALNDHLDLATTIIPPTHHCTRLDLPVTTRGVPERVVCAECERSNK